MIKASKTQSSYLTAGVLLFFLLIFWLTLAPAEVGGPLTYVIVNGNSMEPGFILGDLVLVREDSGYGVGDAVVYYDPDIQQYVFHRIVGLELDRFIMQGDHNSWLDSYHPARNEIVGKLWVHIPKLGRVIKWARTPINTAVIVGLFGVLLMMDMFKKAPQSQGKGGSPSIHPGERSQLFLVGLGVLTILFLALGIYSFTRPLDLPAENISYQQTGEYYYSATGTPGVYDTDVVRSGEPIFPRLTCFLNIGYTYAIPGANLQGIAGSYKMYARILDAQSGWQRTIPLTPDTAFSGASYFNMATLDLCQVEALVNLVESETGLKQIAYTLEIVTQASFVAGANGSPVQDSFSQTLVFTYDKVHFYLSAADSQSDPLFLSKPGVVGSLSSRVNTVSLFGLTLPVWGLRFFSVLGFVIFGLGLAFAAVSLFQDASQSEEALNRLKYGALLVNIHEQSLEPSASVIDVSTMDDLARLAERNGTMILHMPRGFLHFYFVQSGGVTYRYFISMGRKGVAADEAAAAEIPASMGTVNKPNRVKEADVEMPEEMPILIRNRLIYTYPPQKEIPDLDESEEKWDFQQVRTWTPSNPPEYVFDASEAFDLSRQDATLLHKVKI
ncbi:MAG: signal peptidase I [Anaerolineales bacterium]|nr:signal peptidase I [Anaerolineales bacterium]